MIRLLAPLACALTLGCRDPEPSVDLGRLAPPSSRSSEEAVAAPGDADHRRLHPNEPEGHRPITRRGFRKRGEARGWKDLDSENLQFLLDRRRGAEPTPAARMLFPRGWRGGTAPARAEFPIPKAEQPKQIYVSYWLKVSDNWFGHPVVSKIGYVWIGGRPKFYAGLVGKGRGPQRLQARLQNYFVKPAQGGNLDIRGGGEFTRGTWHHCEYVLVANTPGRPDGMVRWWMDGKLVGQATDIAWVGPGESAVWERVSWRPIWGGSGSQIPEDQYMYIRSLYVSGKSAPDRR